MKEILKREYGIRSYDELDAAVSSSTGINLGIFTLPLTERSVRNGQKYDKRASEHYNRMEKQRCLHIG